MSFGSAFDYKSLFKRWQAANEAACQAEDRIHESRERARKGVGQPPTADEIAQAHKLRMVSNELLQATTEELKTRPAPLE
jgi:hypothetical protein